MATFRLTSEPAPSKLHPGHLYAYYDAPTTTGSKATLLLHADLEGQIHRGSVISDDCIAYDDELQHCVLYPAPVVQPQAADDPGLDDEPPARWQTDQHCVAATRTPVTTTWRTTPMGQRRQLIREEIATNAIPTDLLSQIELMCRTYLYIAKRIGVREPPKSSDAKSMAISQMINEMRNAESSPADTEAALQEALR